MRPCTWGRTGTPSARASPARSSRRFHAVGSTLFWLSAKVTGRSMAAESRRIQSISRSGAARSSPSGAGGGQLEHPGAQLAQHLADAEQLVLGGVGAGNGLAVDGPVGQRPAGGEPERAGLDALADDGRHRLDVLGVGGLVAGAALAHDVAAHRAVGHLGRRGPSRGAGRRGRRGTRGSSPSPTRCPPTARRRGCPRRPPSDRSATRAGRAPPARSRPRSCPSRWW